MTQDSPPVVHEQGDRALLYWLANEHPDLFLRLQAMGDRTPYGQHTPPNAPSATDRPTPDA